MFQKNQLKMKMIILKNILNQVLVLMIQKMIIVIKHIIIILHFMVIILIIQKEKKLGNYLLKVVEINHIKYI